MSNAEGIEEQPPHPLWLAAVGYGGLVAFGWLVLAVRKVLDWRFYTTSAAPFTAAGNVERANAIIDRANSFLVDMGYGVVTSAVCVFVVIALLRRSWNAWDYATVVLGFALLLSSIFLCARDRVMFFIPFTLAPLLVLLYLPPVKKTVGVRPATAPSASTDVPATPSVAHSELERELARERTLVRQLRQNLDVFEVERGMSTDAFVDRYVKGLEDETPDNAEWFSIARAVRRSQERIAELQAQLEVQD